MSAAPPSMTGSGLPEGTVVDGRYRVTGTIGSGGFARVYEAHHVMTERQVALKVLDPKANDTDGTFAERFLREARIAASLQHPNVVRVFDVGATSNGQPYIAMELLTGHDLGCEIALNGPLHPDRAYRLFVPVLEALAVGHRQGIVHKDLKPANLFMNKAGTDEETLVILDFGVARVDANEIARLTDTGQLLGTPRYLAPEYIKEQSVTSAIDVYQIALIMSEAIAAYPAVSGNAYSSMMRHCQGELSLPEVLTTDSIGEVFTRATALEPTDRFADAGAFLAALREVGLEFRALPQQPRPPQGYTEARATIITGEGTAPGTVTDSMPMNALDGSMTPSEPIYGPSALQTAYMMAPGTDERGRSHAAIAVLLGLLVLVAAAALAWFLVLTPPDGESQANAAAVAESIEPASAPGVGSTVSESVTVILSSEPGSALFRVDGEPRGETPAMFELAAGTRYELSVELEGYETFTTEVDGTTPGDKKIAAQLEPLPEPVEEPPPAENTADSESAPAATQPKAASTKPRPAAQVKPRNTVRPRRGDDKKEEEDDSGGFIVAP